MSYRVYPVTQTGNICQDYRVFVDGNEVPLNTARVSAEPFNRRWPGHQRQIEQTETVQFLSMAISAPVHIRVIPTVPADTVHIRPARLGIQPQIRPDGSFEFTLDRPQKLTVEPYGTNHALHIFADGEQDYGIDKNAPDVLYYGAGEHDAGVIDLHDGQVLWIDEGAVVYASVSAVHAKHIRIIGRGILDNSKNRETILFETNAEENDEDVGNARRGYTMEIDDCTDVEIDGITIRDSLAYNINFCSCRRVYVRNIKLIGNWRFNSDGVHFANCADGALTDSFLRNYDDCICVRGLTGEEKDRLAGVKLVEETRNILVANNVIWNDWGVCFRIGAATLCKEICNVTFRDCDIIHVCKNAMDCYNCDYAAVHDFDYDNVTVEIDDTVKQPLMQRRDEETYSSRQPDRSFNPTLVNFKLTYHHEYSDKKYNPDGIRGRLYNMRFGTLSVFSNKPLQFNFKGLDDDHRCEHIRFENILLNGRRLNPEEITLTCNEFCADITYKANREQGLKNDTRREAFI